MWFEKLLGFKEENPDQVRSNLLLENGYLVSGINGKSYKYGNLEIPTLRQLKQSAGAIDNYKGKLTVSEVVADVQKLHMDPANRGAMFQVASQFNLLEMVSPGVSPERGVDGYENDRTQGPACAIACGAGTIYRNYFVPLGNQMGQTRDLQIDCLDEIGKALRNEELLLWKMQNGYALASKAGLIHVQEQIKKMDPQSYEKLMVQLKVGIQWDTEVTISKDKSTVSQVYCSALPVAYSEVPSVYWEEFAKLILNATYEAAFYAALINFERTGNPRLYLTLVGGGAFGNELEWIFSAIGNAINKFQNTPIDVRIVSYGCSNPAIRRFIDDGAYE